MSVSDDLAWSAIAPSVVHHAQNHRPVVEVELVRRLRQRKRAPVGRGAADCRGVDLHVRRVLEYHLVLCHVEGNGVIMIGAAGF